MLTFIQYSWHTLLGWALMMGDHYEPAVAHYHEAIALDPEAWVALEGLARCAGEQEQYRDAITWQKKAIDALPQPMSFVSSYLWPRIAQWQNELGDSKEAFEAAEKGFEAEPTSILAAVTLLQELGKRGESAEVMAMLKLLDSQGSPDNLPFSLLVRLFLHGQAVFFVIGWACAKEERPQFVLDAFDKALSIVDNDDREWIKVYLPYIIARVKYTYYGLREDCVVLLEVFLKRLSQRESFQDTYASYRKYARNLLAQLHFDAAVESWTKNPTTRPASADKLKQLAVEVSTGFSDDYEGFDLFRTDYPAMLWGRWLREFKAVEEPKWRKCFRARLLEELNTIDDDDPTNDKVGLRSLAVSLFHAGDRENAAAIMAILFREMSKEDEDEDDGDDDDDQPDEMQDEDEDDRDDNGEQSDETEDEPPGTTGNISDEPSKENTPEQPPPEEAINELSIKPDQVRDEQETHLNLNMQGQSARSYSCDNCYRGVSEVAEMYACEVCSSTTNWCDECLPLLRDEERRMTMTEFRCNPRHPFYRAWPVPEEAKHVAAASFEDGVMVRREWLKNLRQEWWE